MSNPVAVPGTNVPSGAAVSPGGAQGIQGIQGQTGIAYTVTATSPFTVPAVGQTVVVTVTDGSWVIPGQMVNVAGAAGSGVAGAFQVQSVAGNQLTLLNPPPAPAIPPADSTQAGLLKQLSGSTTDYVDGTNTCRAVSTIPPADAAKAGLLKQLSGNATDFVGGDNACHGLSGQVLPIVAGLNRYLGSDATNSLNYAVTVASDFTLTTGVTVYVTPTNTNTGAPTLNVNGTGAKPLVNRANVALAASEISAINTFGAVYDGTSWRIITPIAKSYAAALSGSVTLECAGYTSIGIWSNTSTGFTLTLAHVGYGVPIGFKLYNSGGAAFNYSLIITNPAGASVTTFVQTGLGVGGSATYATIQGATSFISGGNMFITGMLLNSSEAWFV